MTEIPLEQLLSACRRGDARAQRLLFEQYNTRLFAVCLRYARDRPEAQDMLQEAFLTIFRDLGQFQGNGAFYGWLHRVTVRAALQHLRRKNPLRFAEDYSDLQPNDYNISPDMELNSQAILQMVQQLPPGYRTVFNLFAIEGFAHKEIAEQLGISGNTSKSQFMKARAYLRKLLPKEVAGLYGEHE